MAEGNCGETNKVVLIGDFEVGKTSLFMWFKTGQYEEPDERVSTRLQTRAEAEHSKTWQAANGEQCCVTLYDTAGMERFEATVPPTYFRNARAAILVYAIDSQESIDNITHWAESMSIQRLGNTDMFRVLVGNKSDLSRQRAVLTKRGRDTADACDVDKTLFFEVSAKTGEGVDEMFTAVAKRLNQRPGHHARSLPNDDNRRCSC